MKPINKLLLAGLAAAALPVAAHAAPVIWGAATAITASTDIQTSGVTNLEGADFGLTNGTTTTVNNGPGETGGINVAFKSLLYTQSVALTNGITVTPTNFSFNNGAGNGTIGGNYGAILGRHSGVFNNGGTIVLSGLTIDTQYQIQVFCMGGDTATVTIAGSPGLAVGGGNTPGNSSGFGKYAVGTFTADATSQTLAITANTTEPVINALTIGTISSDTTPPTVSSLSPADNATEVSISTNLSVTFSEPIAIGTGDITLKNLTDTTQSTIAITDGSQVSVSGSTLTVNPTTDLTAGKNYAIQIASTAIKDLASTPNFFAGIADDTTWNFSTAAPDLTPPTWTATWPKAEQLSPTSITVRAQTNETGTAYYVVLADGATAPSAAQVKAGNDSSNAPATASGSLALTANVEATGPVTGLTADTSYDVYFIAEDAAPNLQATPVLVDVTLVTPAVVTWGSWTAVTDETAIQTPSGYTYGGVNFNGSNTTINSLVFTGIAQNASGVTNGVTVSTTGFAFQSTGSGNSNVVSAVGSPQTWATVLDRVIGDDNNSASIGLMGLTPGTDYTVQFFSNTPDGNINGTTKITSGGVESAAFGSPHAGGATKYIVGTFTATGTSQSFAITGAEPSFSALVIGVESSNTFANWIGGYSGLNGLTGFNDDADFDGLDNGLENFLGTAPNAGNAGLTAGTLSGNAFTFTHPQNATPASDVSAPVYTWSTDLVNWNADDASSGGISVDLTPAVNTPSAGATTVTATVTGTVPPKLFVRLSVSQN